MEKKHVALVLEKQELYTLWSMCHDSEMYWYKHYEKASNTQDYHLNKDSIKLLQQNIKEVSDKVEAVYYALRERELEENA